VQIGPVHIGQPFIDRLPVKGVPELVPGGNDSISKFLNPCSSNELMPLNKSLTEVLDLARFDVLRDRDAPHGEALSCYARTLQEALLWRAQLVKLCLQHLL